MATVTVRNLDAGVTDRLKALGQSHGRSMEAEVRAILTSAVAEVSTPTGLGSRIRDTFARFDIGDEFEMKREATQPVVFDE
ncbi:hypothetical protein B7R54_08685 [Subtercola boreus]|uniref:Antitoxin FitA-like ribbon-helix-helix domain-containing protein n=1 Tax=Subtercola boreus TaxID=120213 RepID=A0A3E0VK98_9MICO|nr:plasmid stabilization protein [Subtercola boreus]RFA09297.1 hypothetical protein B7R54_08685 [Subtercola boreus]TQL53675.1 hypothetical protein FB464_1191 [Subtercola boreus]